MVDLSVIILSYNTKNITLKCLKRLIGSQLGNFHIEVIIVDNASQDGSLKAVKAFARQYKKSLPIQVIANTTNLGFAAGNNRGLIKAKGNYILLLNSDVFVNQNTLKKQLLFMKANPQFAVSTCKLLLTSKQAGDGTIVQLDPACHRGEPTLWNSLCYFSKLESIFLNSRLFGGYHQTWKDLSQVHDVDAISGAFFMVSKRAIKKVGVMDERFFMYAEDLDWCLRFRRAGYRIAYYPNAQAKHLKGKSGRKKGSYETQSNLSNQHFWETMKQFYQKHYQTKYPKLIMWMVFKYIDYKKSTSQI